MKFKKENFVTDKVREINWYEIRCATCGWVNSAEDIAHYCPKCRKSLRIDRTIETNGSISPIILYTTKEENEEYIVKSLVDRIKTELFVDDRSGRLLRLFMMRLYNMSKISGYCTDEENQFYIISKDRYKKMKHEVEDKNIDVSKENTEKTLY